MTAPPVTIAVVVKDRRDAMARCLDALDALQGPAGREVVLIDNGSTDGTFALLEERAATAPVPTRVHRVTGSIGRARNAALGDARAPVIAFTDSDCVPTPSWCAALLAGIDEGADVVQGRTVPGGPIERRWAATQHIERFTGLYEACNIAYRTDLLRAAGGFGEDIGFFGEDTVAGWRVRRRGGTGAFAPEAVVAHDVTYPGPAWHLRRGFGYRNWNALVKTFPEMRDELLWHRVFLRRRSAATLLAVLGLGTAAVTRRPSGMLLALPLLWRHRPRRAGAAGIADAAAGLAFDGAVAAGLVTGSVRERTVVL